MPDLRPESVAVATGRPDRTANAPVNPSLVLSTTFHHGEENEYLRSEASDSIRAVEAAVGALEGGEAVAFGSGMAAVAAVVEAQPSGAVAAAPVACYGGTALLFADQERRGRLRVLQVDFTDTDAATGAVTGADLVWIESPTNPLLGVVDVPAVAAAAHDSGATVCVDSTLNTPVVARPLDLGADIVMHSATKALGGHSDLLMGLLVTRSAEWADRLRRRRTLTGAMPGALECYLALRGIRTLAVRMDRAQANAFDLATRLAGHPRVTRVRYPGLPTDPFHDRAGRLHRGYGAVISFDVDGTPDDAEAVCERLRLIIHATSLGGVESLLERRARYETDARHGTPPTLLRLSVGIEHVDDLWADLDQALSVSPG
jgi:cystathionine gamma-synthase